VKRDTVIPADARVIFGGILVEYFGQRYVGHEQLTESDIPSARPGDACELVVWDSGSAWRQARQESEA
jgi:hypothetical protein